MYPLLKLIPKNLLSRVVGWLVHCPAPKWMHQVAIGWFIRRYRIDVDEMKESPSTYSTLGDFFVRELKPGIRLFGEGVVSPVDGTLRDVQRIEDGTLVQVKGLTYKVSDLVGDTALAREFDGGTVVNLYLSPRDYHRVHMPINGTILEARYLPGTLWPVNDWAYKNVPALFAKNERLIVSLASELGRCLIIFVGALNVGRITTCFDDWETNRSLQGEVRQYANVMLSKGEELGAFHLGSSILLLFEASVDMPCKLSPESKIRMGESLNG